MSNTYKNNLLVLQDIKKNILLAVDNNQLFIDNRYFVSWRSGYDLEEILMVIKVSFFHYINLLSFNESNTLEDINLEEIKILLSKSIEGVLELSKNTIFKEEESEKITQLYNLLKEKLDNLLDEELDDSDDIPKKSNIIFGAIDYVFNIVYNFVYDTVDYFRALVIGN